MSDRPVRRRWRRFLPLLGLVLAGSLWYGSSSIGYVASLRVYKIPLGSMSPTLAAGDRIAVAQLGGEPARGEIWVFNMPIGGTVVKRVIGLPGETIRVASGRVFIDDRPLDEPYLAAPMTYTMPPVRLGPDEYFVLGDNRNASHDSHVWGPLHKGAFLGRAEFRYRAGGGIAGLR